MNSKRIDSRLVRQFNLTPVAIRKPNTENPQTPRYRGPFSNPNHN